MTTEEMIAEYLAKGGKVTMCPTAIAKGSKAWAGFSPRGKKNMNYATMNYESMKGIRTMNYDSVWNAPTGCNSKILATGKGC